MAAKHASPHPGSTASQDLDTYREYRRRSLEFVEARNRRIRIASR
jgi:hypothetical protein